jgi:hypothetical protein
MLPINFYIGISKEEGANLVKRCDRTPFDDLKNPTKELWAWNDLALNFGRVVISEDAIFAVFELFRNHKSSCRSCSTGR